MYYKLVTLFLLLFYIRRIALTYAEETTQVPTSSPTPVNAYQTKDNKLLECKNFDSNIVKCDFNTSCVYGELNTVNCHVDEDTQCQGQRSFPITFPCLYCWQLPEYSYSCAQNSTCKANTKYLTTCNVNSTTYCLGNRAFSRYKLCNLATGHKWSMALVLSILFGGFGIDRFYLGHWQEGVGKLFSFGGFGVWTLIDTILISIGYLKPVDSSQYE